MKVCSKCGLLKDESQFYHYGKYIRGKCNDCQKSYMKEYNKEYSNKHKEQLIEYQRSLRRNGKHSNKIYRDKFIQMYGEKCECCGETEKVFLALDHKKGIHRRFNKQFKSYMDAVNNFDPDEYRILCHNCNFATREGKICPHKIHLYSTEPKTSI